ncbi:hypothetical protein BH11PLA2_BH11PLA2_23570 [soil metagenome]
MPVGLVGTPVRVSVMAPKGVEVGCTHGAVELHGDGRDAGTLRVAAGDAIAAVDGVADGIRTDTGDADGDAGRAADAAVFVVGTTEDGEIAGGREEIQE